MALDLGTLVAYLKVDDTNLKRGLATAKAQTDKLDGETATVKVDADTATAAAKLELVQEQADHLDGDTATVNVKADTSNATRGLANLSGGVSGITAAVLGLGPALIPVTAAVAGLGMAFAAPLAAAGGGLTLFGLIGGLAVHQTEKQIKAIGDLRKKVDAAKLAVDKASTPAGKKSAMAALADATEKYRLALHNLSPEQAKFKAAQDHLKGAFTHLIHAAGPAVFGPMVAAMRLVTRMLPALKPVLGGVSRGIGTLLKDVAGFANSRGFKAFMAGFGVSAGGAIVTFGRVLENLGKGFVGLFSAMAPLSGSLMGGLTKMSETFAQWGQNAGSDKGFQGFLAYVQKVGPLVAKTFGDLVGAVAKIVQWLAPLGGVILGAVDGIAKFIRNAKPGTLSAIASAVGAVAMAFGKGPLGLAFAIGSSLAQSKGFLTFLQKAGDLAGTLASAFAKLPTGIQTAIAATVGTAAVAKKIGGFSLLGKGTGSVARALGFSSKLGVQKVWVMNPGFGGKGGMPGLPGGSTTEAEAAQLGKWAVGGALATGAVVTAAVAAGGFLFYRLWKTKQANDAFAKAHPYADLTHHAAPLKGGLLQIQNNVAKSGLVLGTDTAAQKVKNYRSAVDNLNVALGVTQDKSKTLGPTVRNLGTDVKDAGVKAQGTGDQAHYMNRVFGQTPKDVHTKVTAPGLDGVLSAARTYGGMLDGLPRTVRTTFISNMVTHHSVGTADTSASPGAPNRTPKGARAMGGPVSAGDTYLVGERGPELFTPRTSGSIIPNHRLSAPAAGGSGAAVFHLHDVDGTLLGTMRGTAQAVVNGQHGFHGTLERMNR